MRHETMILLEQVQKGKLSHAATLIIACVCVCAGKCCLQIAGRPGWN